MAHSTSLGSVKPGKRGGFRVRYYDAAGKQREAYATTRPAGLAILRERSGKVAPVRAAGSVYRFGDLVEDHLARPRRRLKVSTLQSYRALASRHVATHRVWRMPASRVTEVELQDLLDSAGDKVAPRTVRLLGQFLRSVYSGGVFHKRVTDNPMARVALPEAPRRIIRPMTLAESRAVLAHLDTEGDRLRALYALSMGLGIRQGEALALRWVDLLDLDGDAPRVHIHATLRQDGTYEPTTKTRAERTVPLPPEVVRALRTHRREVWGPEKLAGGTAWGRGAEFSDYVFTRDGGRPMYTSTLGRHLRATLEESGVAARRVDRLVATGLYPENVDAIRWHDLRHGFATHALEAGVPMVEVSRWLGHASERVTSDVYYAWTAEAQDRMVGALAALGF